MKYDVIVAGGSVHLLVVLGEMPALKNILFMCVVSLMIPNARQDGDTPTSAAADSPLASTT